MAYPIAPREAVLHFDAHELISLMADIRAGRVNGAISTLQIVANRADGDSKEVFERARFDPRARTVAA